MSVEMNPLDDIKLSPSYLELFDYEGAVRSLARQNSTKKHLTTGDLNESIILATMLHECESTFRIYVKDFEQDMLNDVHNRFESTLNQFILNGGQVIAVVDKFDIDNANNNRITSLLQQKLLIEPYNKKIHIFETNVPKTSGEKFYYSVGDNNMYWIEYDTERRHSQFCFNDNDVTSHLIEYHNELIANSTKVELELSY